MFLFKGTIIRPNTKTVLLHSESAHTLWDPILFTDCIDIKVHVSTILITIYIYIYSDILITLYTGCPRRNVPHFGRVFLMLKYTDITQNTYIQS